VEDRLQKQVKRHARAAGILVKKTQREIDQAEQLIAGSYKAMARSREIIDRSRKVMGRYRKVMREP